jgi:two-component system, LuxR family, response regulator FixJ
MNAPSKLAVCLIDEDPDLRTSIKGQMRSAGIPLVSCANAGDLLESYEQKSVGCVVLDVPLPDKDGLELLQALRQRHVFLPVITLTGHADVPLAVRAIHAGAMDALEKPVREEELLGRVREAFDRYEKLKHFQEERQAIAPRIASLTPRELEVLDLMVAGQKNKLIAERLGISTKTLDIHRANIMRKMQTKTVADLVRWRLMERADPFAINPLAWPLAG